jgi:ActR/RegA family two-component response regulator
MVTSQYDVLVVDDSPRWRHRIAKLLGDGLAIAQAGSVEEASNFLRTNFFYCAVVDQSLITTQEGEDSEGLKVLQEIAYLGEGTKCYLITAFGDAGVAYYIGKYLQIEGYINKAELDEQVKSVRANIQDSIRMARLDYARRYGNGIAQLTKTVIDARRRFIWEDNV